MVQAIAQARAISSLSVRVAAIRSEFSDFFVVNTFVLLSNQESMGKWGASSLWGEHPMDADDAPDRLKNWKSRWRVPVHQSPRKGRMPFDQRKVATK
jgi:hypothetical protein